MFRLFQRQRQQISDWGFNAILTATSILAAVPYALADNCFSYNATNYQLTLDPDVQENQLVGQLQGITGLANLTTCFGENLFHNVTSFGSGAFAGSRCLLKYNAADNVPAAAIADVLAQSCNNGYGTVLDYITTTAMAGLCLCIGTCVLKRIIKRTCCPNPPVDEFGKAKLDEDYQALDKKLKPIEKKLRALTLTQEITPELSALQREIENFRSEFKCSMTDFIMTKPVELFCDKKTPHRFNEDAIRKWKYDLEQSKVQPHCPCCRTKIGKFDIKVNKILQAEIVRKVDEFIETYNTLIQAANLDDARLNLSPSIGSESRNESSSPIVSLQVEEGNLAAAAPAPATPALRIMGGGVRGLRFSTLSLRSAASRSNSSDVDQDNDNRVVRSV